MKVSAILLCCLALAAMALANPLDRERWELFKNEYNRGYGSLDEARFKIFQRNLRRAEELMAAPGNLAEYGVTQFSDLTTEEFASTYLMPKHALRGSEDVDAPAHPVIPRAAPNAAPTSWDWRTKGVVTAVYNQQQCGDCWAFSITETIESSWAMPTSAGGGGHALVELSMQQVTSCDTTDDGCGGGNPPTAYQYVISAGGLESYTDYPFTSGNGNTGYCKFDAADIVASIKSWAWVSRSPNGNEGTMLNDCYTYGPLSICVDASTWSAYRGGIITSNCGTQLDHCVQLVGWNQSTVPYWIVRNSWGVTWGEAGYIYIERNLNLCGISNECTRPCINSC